MNIVAERGKNSGIFIVEYNQEYYLVNIVKGIYAKASPPNIPDQFLRFGYFYPVKRVKAEVADRVWSVLLEGQDVTFRRSG